MGNAPCGVNAAQCTTFVRSVQPPFNKKIKKVFPPGKPSSSTCMPTHVRTRMRAETSPLWYTRTRHELRITINSAGQPGHRGSRRQVERRRPRRVLSNCHAVSGCSAAGNPSQLPLPFMPVLVDFQVAGWFRPKVLPRMRITQGRTDAGHGNWLQPVAGSSRPVGYWM